MSTDSVEISPHNNPSQSKMYFNWSTGKDSAFAVYKLLNNEHQQWSIELLLTTVNSHFDRVSMHGVRRKLLHAQAEALGIPVRTVELPEKLSMEEYQEIMKQTVQALTDEGYTHAGFGDIFLEDLRQNREEKLRSVGISCEFPLWKMDTKELMQEFLRLGFRTIVVSTQAKVLDERFVGREIDQAFLDELPEGVDPCGENGEFHTFCFDGPIFNKPVPFTVGQKIYREYKHENEAYGYWFCDLIPLGETEDNAESFS